MGGLTGGIFALFENVGRLFFILLIGSERASRSRLRTHRVIFGGLLSWAVVGAIAGKLFFDEYGRDVVIAGLAIGTFGGIFLALILLNYVWSLEREERQLQFETARARQEKERQQLIDDLRARERQRIDQKKQQCIPLDPSDERRRALLVNQGIDPDDPHAAANLSGGCFIATAAFDNPLAPEVLALRRWRDTTLSGLPGGRQTIRVYYVISPVLARIVNWSPPLKRSIRVLLRSFVQLVEP